MSSGKRYNLIFAAQITNLFNITNYATPGGNLNSPTNFGKSLQLNSNNLYGSTASARCVRRSRCRLTSKEREPKTEGATGNSGCAFYFARYGYRRLLVLSRGVRKGQQLEPFVSADSVGCDDAMTTVFAFINSRIPAADSSRP